MWVRYFPLCYLVFAWTAAQAAEDAYGPFNLQSGKVTKQPFEDKGKTADHAQVFKAEPDRFFLESSWAIRGIGYHGKNADCHFEGIHRVPVDVTLQNGQKVTIPMVDGFVVRAHAETGSGLTKELVTAWAECEISAKTVRFN